MMNPEELWFLYNEGLTTRQIANLCMVSQSFVLRSLRTIPDYYELANRRCSENSSRNGTSGFNKINERKEIDKEFLSHCYDKQTLFKSKHSYPRHLVYFSNMHLRVAKYDRECDFPYTDDGFVMFCEYIGPIPEGMKVPSVGRIDHSRGYVFDNFRWQELSDNVADGACS